MSDKTASLSPEQAASLRELVAVCLLFTFPLYLYPLVAVALRLAGIE